MSGERLTDVPAPTSIDAVAPDRGVGDPSCQERLNLWPPGLDRGGEPVEFGPAGVGAAGVDAVQEPEDVFAAGWGGAVASRSSRFSFAFQRST